MRNSTPRAVVEIKMVLDDVIEVHIPVALRRLRVDKERNPTGAHEEDIQVMEEVKQLLITAKDKLS